MTKMPLLSKTCFILTAMSLSRSAEPDPTQAPSSVPLAGSSRIDCTTESGVEQLATANEGVHIETNKRKKNIFIPVEVAACFNKGTNAGPLKNEISSGF